jgi:DNA-binding transcriptional MerR regulator
MERMRTPLTTWFWGDYLVSSVTPGLAAMQFQHQLGLSRYETTFQILHKLRAGMVRPPDRIGGSISVQDHVEVDETYIGGSIRGEGKGVDADEKSPVIAAVEVRTRPAKKGDKPMKRGGRYEWTESAAKLISISEMSELCSVASSTLRYNEKLGLITSERETSASHRHYSKATIHRIVYITFAQSAGFSQEIAEQLSILPDIHQLPPKAWEPLRKIWDRCIDQRIAELKQLNNLKRCARDASR